VTLSGLFAYPVKGCAAVPLRTARLDALGIAGDRRRMVVAGGRFLTQRDAPALALVRPEPLPGGLRLHAPGHEPLALSDAPAPAHARRDVVVWSDTVPAHDEGDIAAAWFSAVLGRPVRLVRIADDAARRVSPKHCARPAHTAFTDGFPLLVIGEGSLEELNRRLLRAGAAPVPMSRFRPNLVIDSPEAFAEDRWRVLRVGDARLDLVKPCARCVVTSVDQRTAARPEPDEPLATLATFRRAEGGVLFGQNAVHRGPAELRLGDPVTVGDAP
jgi:uncharacterized protein YcbX